MTLHRLLQGRPTWQVFARPMFAIGIVCPAVLTGLAVFHQLASVQRELDPIGTLTMFAAAFIYFHQSYVIEEPTAAAPVDRHLEHGHIVDMV